MTKIKRISKLLLFSCCVIFLISCNNNTFNVIEDISDEEVLSSMLEEESDISDSEQESSEISMNIQVGNKIFTAIMYENPSTKVFVEKLPLTISMSEINGNEIYYFMDEDIPVDAKKIEKINNGDIMLYGSNCLVVFYKRFNTEYSYTSLGYITDLEGFKEAIDESAGEVTFRLNP